MNKKFYLYILLFVVTSINAQIGIETTTPQAQLDITSNNKGILIPRVALTSLTVQLPVTNPQGGNIVESTLVYHNGTNGISAGYYYWTGSIWQGLAKSDDTRGLQYYAFSGNNSSPNTEKSNLTMSIVNSGLWTGALNDACRGSIRTGDNYTIVFTGTLVVDTPGNFQIQSNSDDGARVIIDNIPVLNRWVDQGVTIVNGNTIYLSKGKHKIEFWYYENSGSEFMQFSWLQNANGATGVINASSFIVQ
jgi:hypothetical protein